MRKIRTLVADDHGIVRMGLASLLTSQADFEIVGEATNGTAAVAMTLRLKPDLVIMDLMMPKKDGATATVEILKSLPLTKIVILTSFGSSDDISRAIKAGAVGALTKSVINSELISLLRQAATGKKILSPDIRQMLSIDPPIPELSPRQSGILESITRGLSNKEIAKQFDISPDSVKTHIAKLFKKIGASSRSEAVAIALRKHLLKI